MGASEEVVFETRDEKRYAPANTASVVQVDKEFEKSLSGIPDKMAFKIGEVAEILDIKPYVLRYWESEFDSLNPDKSKHNQRVYSRRDVETAMMIKKLLYKDKFSIEGARKALQKLRKETKKANLMTDLAQHIEETRDQLQDLIMDISRVKELFK